MGRVFGASAPPVGYLWDPGGFCVTYLIRKLPRYRIMRYCLGAAKSCTGNFWLQNRLPPLNPVGQRYAAYSNWTSS